MPQRKFSATAVCRGDPQSPPGTHSEAQYRFNAEAGEKEIIITQPQLLNCSRSKPHSASCRQGPDEAAGCCTTIKHNTHKTEYQKVRYPWHPLYDQTVIIQRRRLRRGCPTAACVPKEDPERAGLEIPEWMLDATRCSQMRISTRAQVCWMALAELSCLLQQTTCEPPWYTIKDQHRSFTVKGGADENSRSIPTTGATEPVSSSPKAAPMEGAAPRGPAKRAWPASADVVRPPPSGSLYRKARGGRR